MQNGIRHQTIRRDAPQTSGSLPARTSNYHYAAMRRAEQAARSLSTRHSAHTVLAGLTGVTWEEQAETAAARDSYYLLAAAHRSAARKRERAENRALAWNAFTEGPAAYIGCTVRSWAYRVAGAVTR